MFRAMTTRGRVLSERWISTGGWGVMPKFTPMSFPKFTPMLFFNPTPRSVCIIALHIPQTCIVFREFYTYQTTKNPLGVFVALTTSSIRCNYKLCHKFWQDLWQVVSFWGNTDRVARLGSAWGVVSCVAWWCNTESAPSYSYLIRGNLGGS